MLAVIHSGDFTSAKQVAAYLGLIHVLNESSVFKGRSSPSNKGPAWLRAKFCIAASVASQLNRDIVARKQRLLENGKSKMQALGAATRTLVHICYGGINTQTECSPKAV